MPTRVDTGEVSRMQKGGEDDMDEAQMQKEKISLSCDNMIRVMHDMSQFKGKDVKHEGDLGFT